MRTIIYILIIIWGCPLSAQISHDTIFEKVRENYSSAKPIQFNTVYNLYKNYTTQSVNETYKGEYFKNQQGDTFIKINNTEYFLTKKISAQINRDEKIILVMGSDNLKKDGFNILQTLNLFNKGSLKDKKTHWEVELLGKQISQLPYSRIVIHISKDYYIQKQIYYYSNGIDFSKDFSKPDIQAPRLEIICSKPNRNTISSKIFDFSKYFTINGTSLKLSEASKDFSLIDQR